MMNCNTDIKRDIAELKARVENLKADLKQRIQVLEDKEAILNELVRYGFTFDLWRMEGRYELFTEDGMFNVMSAGVWKLFRVKKI